MEPEITEIKQSLQSGFWSLKGSRQPDLDGVVDRLEQDYGEERFVDAVWEYADRQKIDGHFRDMGYESPGDLVESVSRINSGDPERNHMHELQGLYYAFDRIYSTIE